MSAHAICSPIDMLQYEMKHICLVTRFDFETKIVLRTLKRLAEFAKTENLIVSDLIDHTAKTCYLLN